MEPLIINAALTGMVPQRSDSPYVPLTPDEIVADARRCVAAGATILHLHAREPDGTPTYRKEIYQEIIEGVREACPGVLVSGSCSGRIHGEFWQRSQVLDLHPDLGSLTLGSMNFAKHPSINAPDMIQQLAIAMRDRGIIPEMEIFDLGMVDYGRYLIERNIIRGPLYANILLGSLGTLAATPMNLCSIVQSLPTGTIWSATGIGRFQFRVQCLALAMGGHVRVGLEDALYYDYENRECATNAGLIDRVVHVCHAVGRRVSTVDETRARLGLSDSTKISEPTHSSSMKSCAA
jgi:3-keto-5-aminohexanoate cleavage enzyme